MADAGSVNRPSTVDFAQIERIVKGIESMLSEAGEESFSLRQITQDLRHLCDTYPSATRGEHAALNLTSAGADDAASVVEHCQQVLAEIEDNQDEKPTAGVVDRLARSAQHLKHTLEVSMVTGAGSEEARVASSDVPPSYETATMSPESHGNSSAPRLFTPYSDEKPIHTRGVEAGEPSRERRSNKWSSTPRRVCCIAPSRSPGSVVLRTRCFQSKSQLKLALATGTLLQVYDALRDSLLWELHSNSSQLVEGNEEPLSFSEGFRTSPDGSLLCIIAHRKIQRRLLIIDAETGWVRFEHSLSATDGQKPHISPDNTKAVLCHSGNAADDTGHFKIFSLVEGPSQFKVRRLPFNKPQLWQGMGIRFAPDSKHIITCAGPTRRTKETMPSVSVCVYNEATGAVVRSTILPCSPKFNNTSQTAKFAADFHFPSFDEWLVSFPDYSGAGKTCIMNARLGQTVAIFSAELTMSQKWQAGVLPPGVVEVAYDKESGIFTRMELSATMVPRGQTVTITKFTLSANGGREKAVVRKPFQIRVMVQSCKHGDVCGLSPDGSHMFVQQGATGKIDIISLEI